MKKILTIAILSVLTLTASAQTLRVNMGDVTYAIPASQAGDMLYQEGSTLKIGDKVYSLSDITTITIDNRSVSDNSVVVNYSGNTAKVEISGNIAPFITAKVNGAHVCVAATDDLVQNVTYTLSGNSNNGSFYMEGSQAMQLVLNNISLTNPDSAAINIQNGKMIGVELAAGTSNSLADGLTSVVDDGSDGHKCAFYINGHSSWTGSGSLTITGNVKHAYDSDEYTLLNEGLGVITVNAIGDGFHINQYFKMLGGTLNITAAGDGIDVEKKKSDKTDNGYLTISGGTLTVTTTGNATKAMKCDSNMIVTGGVITASTSGTAIYEADVADISSNAAAKCDGTFTMSGGTMSLTSTGAGGKGINATGAISISGGTLTVVTTGKVFEYGTLDTKPQAIKSDQSITLSGGTILSCASEDSGTAFKTDYEVFTNGATLMGIGGKATTGAKSSTHGSKKYKDINVKGGSTQSYDGVTFTIPAIYSNTEAKIIVSSPSM
ncbi:MAG: carbohydrate-binding domain-containing protein [Prevotella sp.]|nr:carbohydrate-binding domain-containing protein [Prevotella sp.]